MGTETVTDIRKGLFGDVSVCRYRFMVGSVAYETEAASLEECRKRCAEWLKKRSVAFSGHRKLQGNPNRVLPCLLSEIRACYASGYRLFYTGGAVGFDTLAAEAVLSEKRNCPDMVLVVAVPFNGQDVLFSQPSSGTSGFWRKRMRQSFFPKVIVLNAISNAMILCCCIQVS